MKRNLYILFLLLPIVCCCQTRFIVSGFTNYDAWVHMDPFYINEPSSDVDNMRPVEYEERVTHVQIGVDSPLMQYWIGYVGVKIHFKKLWANRKHINDGDGYFENTFPMTPYQTRRDYISYALELYFGGSNSQPIKPYIGLGSEFKIEEITSNFIYINNDTDASANAYEAIPVDEHVERRFAYYAVGGVDYRVAKNLYVGAYIRMYFNEIEIDDKWRVHDRVDNAQIRPGIELGFMF